MSSEKITLKLYKKETAVMAMIYKMARKIVHTSKPNNLCFITILKGGLYTAHELFSCLPFEKDNDVIFGYLGLSSYKSKTNPGKIELTYSLDMSEKLLKGRDVYIIDDIADTGATLDKAVEIVKKYNPKSVSTVVLVDKVRVREANGKPRPTIVGCEYNDKAFLVGVGLGYGEKFRGLHSLYKLYKKFKKNR
jgi:hypoxanthine phosphoribosyltransferase